MSDRCHRKCLVHTRTKKWESPLSCRIPPPGSAYSHGNLPPSFLCHEWFPQHRAGRRPRLPVRPSGLCIICECTCLNISDRLLCASIQLRVNPNKKYRCCDYEDGDTIDKPLCTFSHAAIPPTYEVGRNLHMQQIPADPPDGFVEEYHLCMASRQGT